jgi:hypothetical protein
MAPDKTPSVWVPICCGHVMRCNKFRQPNGAVYAALVCTICSKNIILEQEPLDAVSSYGEGSGVLEVLGSPKPPKVERRKVVSDVDSDEPTL